MKELDSLYDSKKLLTLFEQNSLPLHLWNNYGKNKTTITSQPSPFLESQFTTITLFLNSITTGRLFVVWAALKEKGFEDCIDGEGWLCKHWRSYKESIGHGEKWHFTLTTFWVRIIHHASQESHSSFKYSSLLPPPPHNMILPFLIVQSARFIKGTKSGSKGIFGLITTAMKS